MPSSSTAWLSEAPGLRTRRSVAAFSLGFTGIRLLPFRLACSTLANHLLAAGRCAPWGLVARRIVENPVGIGAGF